MFWLLLFSACRHPVENRYYVGGFDDDAAVEKFAVIFKDAVCSENKYLAASLISYPITVHLDGTVKCIINNKDTFMRLFDRIFYPPFKQKIQSARTTGMFVNWQGVMLGSNGEIWIAAVEGNTPLVVAVNNQL
jgi:hypothetical protein